MSSTLTVKRGDTLQGVVLFTDANGDPVDITIGTAQVSSASTADIAAAVWDTLVADLDTANSIGARLAQAATVPSTGAQIAALGV